MKTKRTTQTRSAMSSLIASFNEPLRASDILSALRNQFPSLNKATVYRYLNELAEDGAVVTFLDADGVQLFESVNKAGHPHFACNECKQVFCLAEKKSALNTLLPKGFELSSASVTLTGHCANCLEMEPQQSS